MAVTLRTVIFMGSAKDLVAPWGGDKRLGDRVLTWVKNTLAGRTATCGPDTVKHEVTVYDPLEVFGQGGALHESGAELKHPHFFFKPGGAPPAMDSMRDVIKSADAYIIVSAEYKY